MLISILQSSCKYRRWIFNKTLKHGTFFKVSQPQLNSKLKITQKERMKNVPPWEIGLNQQKLMRKQKHFLNLNHYMKYAYCYSIVGYCQIMSLLIRNFVKISHRMLKFFLLNTLKDIHSDIRFVLSLKIFYCLNKSCNIFGSDILCRYTV